MLTGMPACGSTQRTLLYYYVNGIVWSNVMLDSDVKTVHLRPLLRDAPLSGGHSDSLKDPYRRTFSSKSTGKTFMLCT